MEKPIEYVHNIVENNVTVPTAEAVMEIRLCLIQYHRTALINSTPVIILSTSQGGGFLCIK